MIKLNVLCARKFLPEELEVGFLNRSKYDYAKDVLRV